MSCLTHAACPGSYPRCQLPIARLVTSYDLVPLSVRSEFAVRTFQTSTTRRKRGAGPAGEEARLLKAVRDQWHKLQHLINQ
jgi:hypothetical protein